MKYRCLYAGKLHSPAAIEDYTASHGIQLEVHLMDRHLTESELAALLRDMDASIAGGDPYTSAVMDSAPRVKIIARVGVGYDMVDVPAATSRGIYVTTTPVPELAYAMAEHAFGLMISAAKRIPQRNLEVRQGLWDSGGSSGLTDLYGLKLGLLGLGRIGSELAKRAKSFDMDLQYYDQVRRPDLEDSLGIRFVSFDELLSSSDVVSVHVPLTPETKGMLDEPALRKLKKDAILVNTARGPIIDDDALARALSEGRLGAAALDVLSEEPPSERHVFYKIGERCPNLILTPHRGISARTGDAMVRAAAEDVARVLAGDAPRYPLNNPIVK